MSEVAQKSKSGVSTKAMIGTFAITITMFASPAVTPAMASLFEVFSDDPVWLVSLINSLPSLTTLIGILVFGALGNTRVKYKTIASVGMLVYAVFGILPFWVNDSLAAVLVIRALTGLGCGVLMPIGAAWFLRMVRDRKERGKYLGWNQAIGSTGSFILTFVGGWLCAINWKYTFFAYLFVVLGFLVMLICFREPKSVEQIIKEEGGQAGVEFEKAKRVKISGAAWLIVVIFFLFQMFLSPTMMLFSSLLAEQNAGDAGIAGMLLSLFTACTAITCAFGGRFIKLFGKYTTGIFFFVLAIGVLCIAFGTSLWMFTLGWVLTGIGTAVMFLVNFEISLVTKAAGLAWAASLIMFATNLGNFFSSFWMGFLQGIVGPGDALNFPLVVGAALLALLGVIFIIMNSVNKKAWGKDAVEAREAVPVDGE